MGNTIQVDRKDLCRLFVVAALNAEGVRKAFPSAPGQEQETMIDVYHSLAVTVERIKIQLGFKNTQSATDVASGLIIPELWGNHTYEN